MPSLKKFFSPELLRFVITGALNTGGGYVIYVCLLLHVNYKIAYSVSFMLSVLLSYVLNAKFVFKKKLSFKKLLQFPMVYLAQYTLGIFLLFVLIQKLSFPAVFAPLVVVAFTIPLTFFLSRFILTK